jgi:hypothetical protein
MIYGFLADLIAVIHVGYVLCVVLGLLIILIGWAAGWQWVRNRWFRLAHLAMIGTVVLRALVWPQCPLSWWEYDLRKLGGQVDADGNINYEGHRLGEFFHKAIHPEDVPEWNFNPPAWVYLVVYSLFGGLVVATFWLAPVRWRVLPPPTTGPPATV